MTKDYNEAGKATARIDIRVPKELKAINQKLIDNAKM